MQNQDFFSITRERFSDEELITKEVAEALNRTQLQNPAESFESKVIARFYSLNYRFYALGSLGKGKIYGAALKEDEFKFGSMTPEELREISFQGTDGKDIGMKLDRSIVPLRMTLRECITAYEVSQTKRQFQEKQVLSKPDAYEQAKSSDKQSAETAEVTDDTGLSEASRSVLKALMAGISVRITNQEHLKRIEEALSGRFVQLEKDGKVPVLTIYDRSAPSRSPIHIQGPTQSQQRER